jgi:hypothetical protein
MCASPPKPSELKKARKIELHKVMQAEKLTPDSSVTRWHVISCPWLAAWLSYTTSPTPGPRPGPVSNASLTVLDKELHLRVAKPGLRRDRAGLGSAGDYRIVKKEVWDVFMELYAGGPAITVNAGPDADMDDCASWFVLQDEAELLVTEYVRMQNEGPPNDANHARAERASAPSTNAGNTFLARAACGSPTTSISCLGFARQQVPFLARAACGSPTTSISCLGFARQQLPSLASASLRSPSSFSCLRFARQ